MRLLTGLCVLGAALPAFGQAAPIPRAADGRPDLHGMWDADFATPLERPDGIGDLVVTPDKAADALAKMKHAPKGAYDPDIDYFMPDRLLVVNGAARSSWLVEPRDGRLPMTALAKAAAERGFMMWNDDYDNPEERPASERCLSSLGHPPITAVSRVIPSQIIQTADAVVVTTEDTDSTRIIHLAGEPPPDAVRSRAGWSQGRWDGDTLVVETTHFSADDPVGLSYHDAVVTGEASTVVERFTLIAPGQLLYQFTVLDRALYEKPWLAEYVLQKVNDPVYEYACHEGNQALTHILTAARLGRQKKDPPKDDATLSGAAKPGAGKPDKPQAEAAK